MFIFCVMIVLIFSFFFFFNDTATTEIYTLSLHDALPHLPRRTLADGVVSNPGRRARSDTSRRRQSDRKSTRLNSSHVEISYAVFCLKKKKNIPDHHSLKQKKKKKKN